MKIPSIKDVKTFLGEIFACLFFIAMIVTLTGSWSRLSDVIPMLLLTCAALVALIVTGLALQTLGDYASRKNNKFISGVYYAICTILGLLGMVFVIYLFWNFFTTDLDCRTPGCRYE